jgi:hypothetical protein
MGKAGKTRRKESKNYKRKIKNAWWPAGKFIGGCTATLFNFLHAVSPFNIDFNIAFNIDKNDKKY